LGTNIASARNEVYGKIANISFDYAYYRSDIAAGLPG
jgi:phosphoribosylamine-glycine ligase